MQRVIKFRVWDKINKQFRNPIFNSIDINTIFKDDGILEFNQFTGLKDNNGVEIYEGDIINFDTNYARLINVLVNYSDELGAFTVAGTYIGLTKNIEIIGNFYQNTGLLK